MYKISGYEMPPNFSAALMVIAGAYGNGEERIKALKADGYDYNIVQKCVNELVKVMNTYG